MKKAYLLHILFIFSSLSLTSCNRTEVAEEDSDQSGDYEQPAVWTGPGFYYGIWFGSELDFNNYHERHYRGRDRDRDRDRDNNRNWDRNGDHSKDHVPGGNDSHSSKRGK